MEWPFLYLGAEKKLTDILRIGLGATKQPQARGKILHVVGWPLMPASCDNAAITPLFAMVGKP
ncbi:hypothetical protein [uncultured Cohaesibacter sp.]|uniref:hypothetical protein n=1 Tax=uncultured Cohaesibacter sp. TaxID=1002546 RepID=UPI00292E3F74